jgi:hypothetical protein
VSINYFAKSLFFLGSGSEPCNYRKVHGFK